MGKPSIFSRLFFGQRKSFTDPLAALFGLGMATNAAGVSLTVEQALTIPAVSNCIRLIAEAVATMEICAKAPGKDPGTWVEVEHPAVELLRGAANPWTSGYELIRDLVIDALMHDRGGMVWVNRVAGQPVELVRFSPGILRVDYNLITGEPTYFKEVATVPASDMVHMREPFDRAPLTLAREAMGAAVAMGNHAARLFGQGARPSGALKFPKGMAEASVVKARAAWAATHEGNDAGGKTAILHDGAEFEPFTMASTDAQFIENRNFAILEICRSFRVPPSMAFQLDRATWNNTEQMGDEFLVYCLEPRLKALEGALTRALIGKGENVRIVFDRDDMTRADLMSRATAISSLIASRVINPNTGRDWLGLEPYQGGDEFFNPNITSAGAANGSE